MTKLPDAWWDHVTAQLQDVLDVLDRRGEHMVAAHVATALDCIPHRRTVFENNRS